MARQETEEGQTIEKLNETNSVGAISDISDVRDWKQRGGKTSSDVLNLQKMVQMKCAFSFLCI